MITSQLAKKLSQHSLKKVGNQTSKMKEMKFTYADVHGNPKFILNTPVKNRYVIDYVAN